MVARREVACWLLASTLLLSSCQRSCGDVWEDTKTCSRHLGRGFCALFGKHATPARPCTSEDFAREDEQEFIPFRDEDLYRGIMRGDELALLKIDADTPIPQSRFVPGDIGCPIPGIEAFREPSSAEQLKLFAHIHFETDDYSIRGGDNLESMQKIATYLKGRPSVYLFIEGHCDERGPAAYNLALGTRRANAIRNALIKEGVDPDRLLTISYGKERPLAVGHDAAAWKINRRGQFRIHEGDKAPVCVR
jgi:peptidoglycan-associated lipoprotein